MALTITTNMESMIVRRNLNSATNSLNTAIERMTTGYKINHASDNAAGYSIASSWVTKLGSLDVASDNALMGADMLSTAEENYGLISGHLQRIRDLAEQAANGTYGSVSLKAIQAEVKSRLEEISRISANAEFNGIGLMSSDSTTTNGIDLHVGLNASDNSVIKLASTLFTDSSVSGLFNANSSLMSIVTKANNNEDIDQINSDDGYTALALAFAGLKKDSNGNYVMQTEAGYRPKNTLAAIDKAIQTISSKVTTIGASQNRVQSAIEAISVQTQNLTSSLSTIRDTDVSEQSSRYIQAQILQQASATLLATANQAPSVALNLI